MAHIYSKFTKNRIIQFFLLSIFILTATSNTWAQCPPEITPIAPPGSNVIINGDNAAKCPDETVQLSVLPSTGVTYEWYHNNIKIDTISNDYQSFDAPVPGDYHVLIFGNICTDQSNTIHVDNFELPNAIITFSENPVCPDDPVDIELSIIPNTNVQSWFWILPDAYIGSTQNPIENVIFTESTAFSAVITTYDGCATVKNAFLTVYQELTPGVLCCDDTICSGTAPNILTCTSPSGGNPPYDYWWQHSTTSATAGFTNIASATSANYQPGILTQTTWYRRVVESDWDCGNITQVIPIEIIVNPIPVITSVTSKSICSGDNVNYTPESNVAGTTFTWTGSSDGTVSGVTPTGSSNTGSGIIDDLLTIAPGGSTSGIATYIITPTGPAPTYCPGTPITLTVTVMPLPIPTISGPNPVCLGSIGNIYVTEAGQSNYFWTCQGGNITAGQSSSQITVTWTTIGNQIISVTYTGSNGCGADTPTEYPVTVNPLPIPIISGPNLPCLDDPGNVYSTESGMTNYIWDTSSGATITSGGGSSDNTVTITWNNAGPQWVSVIYTNTNGCTNSSATQFNINVSTASLSGPESPCVGSTSNVYTTDPGMSNYIWDKSIGGTITSGGGTSDNTITITWDATGSQNVTVNYTSTSGCTTTPTTLNIDVKPLPTPTLSGDNDVCKGSTGHIYNTESGKSLYLWDISGGTITSGGTPVSNTATVTWDTEGPQEISVNYEDANGCTAESSTIYPVTVKPLPVPTISGSNSECEGTSGLIYLTESGKTNYIWTISSGGIITIGGSTNQITVTWTSCGNNFVTVDYEDNGCFAETPTIFNVTVKCLPIPIINGPSSVCIDATNIEYTTETGMTNYDWTVPTGGTVSGVNTNSNVFVDWDAIGSHTVLVNYTGTNGCTATSASIFNVTVNPLPSPSITGPDDVCANSTGNIYTTQPGMTDYDWDVSSGGSITNGGSSTDNTVTITWITSGAQSVTVNYSQTGCPAASPITYNITVNPLPTSNAGVDQLIPYGSNTTLEGFADEGTPNLWPVWTPESEIDGDNTTLIVQIENIYDPTDFTLTITDSKGCIATDLMQVTLDGTALNVLATASPTEICNNLETVQLNATATGGNSNVQADYTWYSIPDGFNSLEQNPFDNPTQTTTYYVDVFDGYNHAINSVYVPVNPLPIIYSITGGGEYCDGGSGLPVELDGSELGVDYQLKLDGDDHGLPEPGTAAAFSFGNMTSKGIYTVHAINATTGCEQNMNGSVEIIINPLPTAYAGPDQTIPHGIFTTLTGSNSGGTSPLEPLWTPPTMIYSGATTLSPQTENIYETIIFNLQITDIKGCEDNDQVQIIVNGNPLSVVASVDINTICDGDTAQLSASGSGGSEVYTFAWSSNPIGFSSNEQNPTDTPSTTTLYTVTIDDGYNTATSSVTIIVNPLPDAYTITGGGSYCSGGTGVEIWLSNSDVGVDYRLYLDDGYTGNIVPGTGVAIPFGNQFAEGNYTVKATIVSTDCENTMTGSVSITILPLPEAFLITGGGSYPDGGIGVIVGLSDSEIGINYRLINNADTLTTIPGLAGTGSPIDFSYQTLAGDYTAFGTNEVTGCVINMLNSVTVVINPYPGIFNVFGGDTICNGDATEIGIDGSEIGIEYTLLRDNISIISNIPGINDSIIFGTFGIEGTYTVEAKNTSTGLEKNMAGNAEIIVQPSPVLYNLSYLQPGDNCIPIIPHLSGSDLSTVYELNYEDFNGYYTSAIDTLDGTGSTLNFDTVTNPGIYTVTAITNYVNISCTREMMGSLIADSIPKEFEIIPQGEICEDSQELCLLGSEPGINYQLWLNDQPIGQIIPGKANGDSICFGILYAPGTYRIHAINSITNCEIFFTEEVTVNPIPLVYVMSPIVGCAGSEIILDSCESGINYYLFLEGNGKEFIQIGDSISCNGGSINFGQQFDEGTYYIKAVNPVTNCYSWMDSTTTIFPNPQVFEVSPLGGGCPPLEIYLTNFETDALYYLYRINGNELDFVETDDGLDGSVSFSNQYQSGYYTVKALFNHSDSLECWSDMSNSVQIFNTPEVFTLLPVGPFCPDVVFHLSGSQSNINYILISDLSGPVDTIIGNGNIIYFDTISAYGNYSVMAYTNNDCQAQMNGIRTVLEKPTSYSITPTVGQWCSNDFVEIGLDNSDVEITYELHRDNFPNNPLIEINGTGSSIIFGNYTVTGIYRVKAINDTSTCERWMDGKIKINLPPNIYSLTGNGVIPQSGWYCPPVDIGLNSSDTGIQYTLSLPDNNNMILFGTGNPLNFGTFSQTGIYTIDAFDSITSCSSNMYDTIKIYQQPEIYNFTSIENTPAYCSGIDTAISLMLSYSQIGVVYQLNKNGGNQVGLPQPGNNGIIIWDNVSQYGSGSYYVEAFFPDDPNCTSIMNGIINVIEIPSPTASISGVDSVCVNSNCTDMFISVTGVQPIDITYTDGSINFTVELDPIVPTHAIQVCPTITTVYQLVSAIYSDTLFCEGNVDGTFTVVVDSLPEAFAGNPITECVTEQILIDEATVSNYSTFIWEITNGFGTLDSYTLLHPTYTPDISDQGTIVTLTLTVSGIGGCSDEQAVSSVDLTIESLPIADAGPNMDTCISVESIIISDATVLNTSSVLWQHDNGTGYLSDYTVINPTYYPHSEDEGKTVTFTLTAQGQGECNSEESVSSMTISFDPLPTISDVCTGDTICETEDFPLTASAQNYSSVLWEIVQGSGSFSNPNNLNSIFYPDDVNNITIMILKLTAFGINGCSSENSESLVEITVFPTPDVYAGSNDTICGLDTCHLDNATAPNSTYYYWTTSGTGQFDNEYNLNPVYYPSQEDLFYGSVKLILEASNEICQNISDSLIITLSKVPLTFFTFTTPVCSNTQIFFEDQSITNSGIITKWEWNLGDGSDPIIINWPENPDITYSYIYSGPYEVSLTATNSFGCSTTTTNIVIILPGVVAAFDYENNCSELETSFTDLSQVEGLGDIAYWNWNFGDPLSGLDNTSTEQNPIHIFAEAGDYDVTLIIESAQGCLDTVINQITVNLSPPVDFLYDITCQYQVTYFQIDETITNISEITDFLWDFGDGLTSTSQNPEHIYNVAGEYTVNLQVIDINECTSTISHIIDVHPTPIVAFNPSLPTCQNSEIQFTDYTTTGSSYVIQWVWDMGDGNIITIDYPDSPDITHVYATSGTFQVDLWVITTDSCENSASQQVVIIDSPIADFTFEDACVNQDAQFTDNSTPTGGYAISQWIWNFDDPASGNNNFSYIQNPVHSFTQAGTYNVSLEVFNTEGCSDTLIQQITPGDQPPVEFITSAPTCFNDLTYFYADSILMNISSIESFEWNFGDGSPTSNQQNPVYLYQTSGDFDVSLAVVDTSGCENLISHLVSISPRPQATFDFANACQNDTTYFTDFSSSGSNDPIIEWAWDFGDPASSSNTSTLQNPIHVYENASSYQAQLVVTCMSGCSDSLSREIIVNPLPTANYNYSVNPCQNGLVSFTDSSYAYQTSINEWYWIFEPGYNSTLRNPIYNFNITDTCYAVSLTVTDGRGCQHTIIDTVCIPAGLELDFTYSPTCFNEVTSFFPELLNPPEDTLVMFNWNFGDLASGINNTSNVKFPMHDFTAPGDYTVSLEAMDQFGCTKIIYKQITVELLPIPEFSYESSICDSIVNFDDLSDGNGTPIQSWIWIFGDTTPNDTIIAPDDPDISHAYSNPGFYNVTLIVTNTNGCQDTISHEIFREFCIKADFEILDTLYCQYFHLNFSDSSLYNDIIYQWSWTFGDGYDTTYSNYCTNITHDFETSGTFDIRLIVNSLIGTEEISDTIIKSITIIPSPIANFICEPVCLNDISYFEDISNTNGTEIISWLWDFNDPDSVVTTSEQNPWYHYNVADSFNVKLLITSENNCYDSVIQTTVVNPIPIADFEWINACMLKATDFTDLSNGINGVITNWNWDFGNLLTKLDTSTISNPYYIYDTLGDYNVKLIVTNENGCIDTSMQTVTINPVQNSEFSFIENYENIQGQIKLENKTIGDIDSYWLFGDGGDSQEDNPIYKYNEDGDFSITLITWNEYDCPDTAFYLYKFIFKGLYVPNAFAPENEFTGVRLFKPIGVNLDHYNIKIFDSWGHLLWESDALDDTGGPSEGWDGNFKNDPMPMDVYIWKIRATFIDGSVWEGKSVGNNENGALETTGTVTLIR